MKPSRTDSGMLSGGDWSESRTVSRRSRAASLKLRSTTLMGLLHRFLDHRTPDAWSRLESPLRDLGHADQTDGGPVARRRAGCLTYCSGVTKNRHWSIQAFSFSDAELDAEWGMIYGYARVSTDAQDLAIQLDLLRA